MHASVVRVKQLTPSLVRVVLGGEGLMDFEMPETTDTYVNLAFPNLEAATARRRYTVRAWDLERRELTIDFVVHGDEGVAGPWAASARPGDRLEFTGPSGGYRPDADADWHLFVGDEAALPAIAASLEVIPADASAVVRLVCDGPDHRIALSCPGRLDIEWLERTGHESDGELLLTALRDLTFPPGSVHAFVHGEADEIRGVRRHLLAERGLPRRAMSCSPYWRRSMDDEAWRRIKRDFVATMEADTA